jgi:Fe2+ transport system protein B
MNKEGHGQIKETKKVKVKEEVDEDEVSIVKEVEKEEKSKKKDKGKDKKKKDKKSWHDESISLFSAIEDELIDQTTTNEITYEEKLEIFAASILGLALTLVVTAFIYKLFV